MKLWEGQEKNLSHPNTLRYDVTKKDNQTLPIEEQHEQKKHNNAENT